MDRAGGPRRRSPPQVEEEIVLVANEDYWRTEPAWEGGHTGAPRIKTIILKNVTEFSTRYSMLQAGDAEADVAPPSVG